ncbi:P-loop containing nucleoside triphosphate hydrolase protein [Macrolepiota fuliginosa MF-IS2]|uniref:P-loop containing nucleoside triphosphate hydrolase protein n=1 Tax=Macrolepiota fuliginosa MF-IS2 TaxID=1400762 RepID=A0A9P6C0U1_9AGAR|nr:P-loop containing nucleoside triphosphate hydrolase protein [Macrolepiota fuliginosa MF-IS2]
MFWLSKQPSWKKARKLEIYTDKFGLSSSNVLMPSEENNPNVLLVGDRRLSYKPSPLSSHSFWYRGYWCRIGRWEKEGTQTWRKVDEYLRLSILSRDQKILKDLIIDAEKAYKAAQEDSISIHASEPSGNSWRHLATRPKRPLSSIVLDPGIKDKLVGDAREFLESKNWYAARGIPFRRGYLLYGAPGSGKTSIIQSLAGELGLDIYIVSLSRVGMDDNGLNELISRLPEKCIALMEDIDAAFTTGISRDPTDVTDKPNPANDAAKAQVKKDQKSPSRVTLSGLLNALDGVAAQEGRLLFATTNKYSALDPALTRPGRMDLHIEFKLASKHQAKELYRCFYAPDTEASATPEPTVEAKSHPIGDLESENDVENEKPLIEVDEISSMPSSTTTTVFSTPSSPTEKLLSPTDTSPSNTPLGNAMTSLAYTKTMTVSESTIEKLADIFSDTLPDREFSMASLQGYLMTYKTNPTAAIHDFPGWIERERREKVEQEKKNVENNEKKEEVKDTHEAAAAST